MKTLRKGDEFKRMKNKSREEWDKIQHLVRHKGWEFCDKTTWKELRDGSSSSKG
jgi:hypothetical protein